MSRGLPLALAVVLDAALGDPPNAVHPVAWLGSCARAIEARVPRMRVAGGVATLAVAGGSAGAAWLAGRLWPRALGGHLVVDAVLLSACTGRRSLFRRAGEVAAALESGDLPEARRLLSYHLVSRDASVLGASEVAGAAVESVAENLSDGVVAPWCWYVLGGAPAVAAYRALNTLDGMWGYRTEGYEAFGATAARADDVANLLPARLTALALIAAAAIEGEDARGAFDVWQVDRGQTASPNAGHPMSAAAGALGLVLEKRGEYRLGASGRASAPGDIRRAVRLADTAAWLVAAGLLVAASLPRSVR